MTGAALSLRQCELCGFYVCPEPDQCAVVLRLSAEERASQCEDVVSEPDDGCGCGVVGDEDVTCERCKEYERDERLMGVL